MIVCTQCGHHNPDGKKFCEACDEYLAWAGQPVEEQEPEPEPEPESEVVLDEPDPEPLVVPKADVDPDEERAVVDAERQREDAERAERELRDERARSLVAPPTDTTEDAPPKDQIEPTKPTVVKKKKKAKKTTVQQRQRVRPGDVVCVKCGTGNPPDNNFCKKCGFTLEDAQPAAVLPWWKRLFRREPRTHEAGFRRGRRGTRGAGGLAGARSAKRSVLRVMGTLGRTAALLALVVGALGVSVGPWRSAAVGWVTDRFDGVRQLVAPSYEPLNPTGATATSSLPEHPPADAIDLGSNTWWAEGADGDGVGEIITVTFGSPVDIALVGIIPGVADPARFVQEPRPRSLHLVFDNGVTKDVPLVDAHEFQTFEIEGAEQVTSVEIHIDAVWPAQSGSAAAITEIEFRARS